MGNRAFIAGLCLINAIAPPSATSAEFTLDNFVQYRTAAHLDNSQSTLQLNSLQYRVKTELDFDSGWHGSLSARLRYQSEPGLTPHDKFNSAYAPMSEPALLGEHSQLELRDALVEGGVGAHHFVVGKQQVVWGKADGIKVLDVVNPQSFEEFILEDFEESRIPTWMVNYEITLSTNTLLQLLWIPDNSVHVLPKPGARYQIISPLLVPVAPAGVNVQLNDAAYPGSGVTDSNYGTRVTSYIGGWDVSVNYLTHYDHTPGFYTELLLDDNEPIIAVTPRYRRTEIWGGSASTSIGDFTVRTETAFTFNQHFQTSDVQQGSVITADVQEYLLGVDWYRFSDTVISGQWFTTYVNDASDGLIRERTEHTGTLLLRRSFNNQTLEAEILVIQSFTYHDNSIRPKISYQWNDATIVWAGIDAFSGNREGLYGQHGDNDRVLVGFEVSF